MIAKGGITMQDYNTIIGSIQMRLNGCQTRSVMDRYKIGSGTLNLIMSRFPSLFQCFKSFGLIVRTVFQRFEKTFGIGVVIAYTRSAV